MESLRAITPSGLIEFSTSNTLSSATTASSTDRTIYRTSDKLGSAVLVINSAGLVIENNRTLPYGEAWLAENTPSTNDKKFTSYQRDQESGLDYAMNRYYVNTMGRFVSPDKGPMFLRKPGTLNRYSYTASDPINKIDPDGMQERPNYCDIYPDDRLCSPYPVDICTIFDCLSTPQRGQPGPDATNARANLLRAIDRAIEALMDSEECRKLFGNEQTRAGKWDPVKVLNDLTDSLTTNPGASPIEVAYQVGLAGAKTTGNVLRRVLPGVNSKKVTIRVGLELAEGANVVDLAHLVLHELGHAYDLLDGSGGSVIKSPDSLPVILGGDRRSKENDWLVDQKCFGGSIGYQKPGDD